MEHFTSWSMLVTTPKEDAEADTNENGRLRLRSISSDMLTLPPPMLINVDGNSRNAPTHEVAQTPPGFALGTVWVSDASTHDSFHCCCFL
jgi:hypothetical protein